MPQRTVRFHSAATDKAEAAFSVKGVAKIQSAQTFAGLAQDPETESTWTLQLLSSCG